MGNKFNFAEAREKAVRAADQELEQGMEEIGDSVPGGSCVPSVASDQRSSAPASVAPVPNGSPSGKEEPTKGVQTYIPMSQYRRLNDIKLTRRENIAALVAQAIELWLDIQEGKIKVSATT